MGAFSATILGWNVDQAPPPITGYENFGRSPGPAFPLQKPTNFSPIEIQTISPGNINSTNLSTAETGNDWIITPGSSFDFDITTPFNCDVELLIDISGASTSGMNQAVCYVKVNDHPVGQIMANAGRSTQKLTIPWQVMAAMNLDTAKGNVNTVVLDCGGQQSSFIIFSITAQSNSTNIEAYGQWMQLAAGTLAPGGSTDIEVQVSSGTTTSRSESVTIASELNVECNTGLDFGFESILKGLSLAFSMGFSESQSRTDTHDISLHEETAVKHGYKVAAPTDKKVTYQLWQLAFIYRTPSGQVVQYLGLDVTPVIVNTYESYKATGLNKLMALGLSHDGVLKTVNAQ